MKKAFLISGIALVSLFFTTQLFAAGHDVGCVECHSAHVAQGVKLLAKPANTQLINPRDGKPITSPTSLCMACHNGDGGPEINLKSTHPVCVTPDPKIAVVPKDLLRNDQLHCSGCHDFHPSNDGSYKYLRFGTQGAEGIGIFCTGCHADKGAPGKIVGQAKTTEAPAAPAKK